MNSTVQRVLWLGIGCLLGMPTSSGQSTAPEPMPYMRQKIMHVIKEPRRNLTLVSAHRGYWETYPENSWEAIHAAGQIWESVEADIKPASDGPVVMHDVKVDRVTDGAGDLSNYTVAQFTALHLRDRLGNITSYNPMSAGELFLRYGQALKEQDRRFPPQGRGYVLALDVKMNTRGESAWSLVEDTYGVMHKASLRDAIVLGKSVIYKIEARSLPKDPRVLEDLVARNDNEPLNVMVVLNLEDSSDDEIVAAYSPGGKDLDFIYGWEISYKFNGSEMDKYSTLGNGDHGSLGSFTTYYDLPEGVGTSQAICCSVLNTDTVHYFPTAHPIDYRSRWVSYITGWGMGFGNPFKFFTSDRPDVIIPVLNSNGLRDTSYIEP